MKPLFGGFPNGGAQSDDECNRRGCIILAPGWLAYLPGVGIWIKNLPPKNGCINDLQGICVCVIGFANRHELTSTTALRRFFPLAALCASRLLARKSAGATVSLDSFAE